MPLVTTKEMFEKSMKEHFAIGAFNVNNMEIIQGIVDAAAEEKSPVILQCSHGAIKYARIPYLRKMIEASLEEHDIPIVLHLDHGPDFETCKMCINNGFTSVMIDASLKRIDTNIDMTNEVIEYARKKRVIVESEIGSIGKHDASDTKNASVTGSIIFVKKTKVDLLAPAVGNVHGIYKEFPNINVKLIKEISENTDLPLVLHGASGINNKTLRECIKNGICKVNINTDLQVAWAKEVRKLLETDSSVYDPRKIISSGEKAVVKVIKEKLETLNSINRY